MAEALELYRNATKAFIVEFVSYILPLGSLQGTSLWNFFLQERSLVHGKVFLSWALFYLPQSEVHLKKELRIKFNLKRLTENKITNVYDNFLRDNYGYSDAM